LLREISCGSQLKGGSRGEGKLSPPIKDSIYRGMHEPLYYLLPSKLRTKIVAFLMVEKGTFLGAGASPYIVKNRLVSTMHHATASKYTLLEASIHNLLGS
jgi:hypothetical protein